jgi:hypothetical protein
MTVSLEDRMNAFLTALERGQDLSLLKKEADALCAAILKLPPTEARQFQPLIGEAITKLDEMERLLKNEKS